MEKKKERRNNQTNILPVKNNLSSALKEKTRKKSILKLKEYM